MTRASTIAIAALACVFVLAGCGSGDSAPQAAGPPIAFSLAGEGGSVASVPITVTLTNHSDEPTIVVRPFVSPTFVRFTLTEAGGEDIAFIGAQLKLAPLEDEDFTTLAPGESVSSDFDLAALFALPAGTVFVTAEYRNPPEGSHKGGRAFTAGAGDGISADRITIEVSS
jgi:hypothetical protein